MKKHVAILLVGFLVGICAPSVAYSVPEKHKTNELVLTDCKAPKTDVAVVATTFDMNAIVFRQCQEVSLPQVSVIENFIVTKKEIVKATAPISPVRYPIKQCLRGAVAAA